MVTLSGSIPAADQALIDILPKSSTSSPSLDLSLLMPLAADASAMVTVTSTSSSGSAGSCEVQGQGRLSGVLEGVAVVHKRESFGRACRDLKVGLSRVTAVSTKCHSSVRATSQQRHRSMQPGHSHA